MKGTADVISSDLTFIFVASPIFVFQIDKY